MRPTLVGLLLLFLLAVPAVAKVGDSAAGFATSPLVQQLRLTSTERSGLDGGRTFQRYVSDDQVVTVDLVVSGGRIEQQIMYLPMTEQRGFQVSMFLQDALGSLVGSQTGLVAFRSTVANRKETSLTFGGLTMRFTPMPGGLLRVMVSR